jgi:LysM repeat protein
MRPTDPDHRTPFDHESDHGVAQTDLTEEFWGNARGWDDRTVDRDAPPAHRQDDTTGTIRAIRDGVAAFRPQRVDLRDATGQMRRTRVHGSTRSREVPAASQRREHATIGELAAGGFDETFDDDLFDDDPFLQAPVLDEVSPDGAELDDRDDVPLSPVGSRRGRSVFGAVDPLLVRFGALALVGVLMVPVALSLRSSEPKPNTVVIESPTDTETDGAGAPAAPDASGTAQVAENATDVAASSPAGAPEAEAPESAASAAAGTDSVTVTEQQAAPASDADEASTTDGAEAQTDAIGDDAQNEGAIDQPATVDATAERVEPACPQTYTAGAGDSWYRIADAAGLSPGEVLAENRATGDTVILPGDEICLPADATIPTAPVPAADPEPDTTDAPTTTAAPATTVAPTTTSPPAPPASVDEVKALIRATWPAEEHETAMMIAQRESRFNPRADNNWCCYGVFQIYFEVHQRWLDDFGVYEASDLFDAEKNIAAAYHLYEQSGGWGPWGF